MAKEITLPDVLMYEAGLNDGRLAALREVRNLPLDLGRMNWAGDSYVRVSKYMAWIDAMIKREEER